MEANEGRLAEGAEWHHGAGLTWTLFWNLITEKGEQEHMLIRSMPHDARTQPLLEVI